MAKNKPAKGTVGPSGQTVAPPLPPGVKLLGTLEGYQDAVVSVAFDPQGGTLASVSRASGHIDRRVFPTTVWPR
jgi:hypothetical protein